MKEALDNAITEIKRVDHLFYVSLKYTRTADMMKHTLERIISTFTYGIESLLKQAKEEKKIEDIPENNALRCKLAMETFNDPELNDFINFYMKLRKINRAEYTKREEFRRHVTMTLTIDTGEVIEVNIDELKGYYDRAKEFVKYVRRIVHGEEEL
jgi:hypothetical protein